MKTKRLVLTAMLTGIALVIFILEAQIPIPAAIPGVKLGLANIVTLFAMVTLGKREAFIVMVLRIIIGSIFVSTPVTAVYSLSGGLCCFAVMCLSLKLLGREAVWAVSAFGAVSHNIGQLTAAWVVTGIANVFLYAPVLVIAGVCTGIFTGLCAYYLLKNKYIMKLVGEMDYK